MNSVKRNLAKQSVRNLRKKDPEGANRLRERQLAERAREAQLKRNWFR